MILLSGIPVREKLSAILAQKLAALPAMPELAIIHVGTNAASDVYIGQKKKFGQSLGVPVRHISLGDDASEADVVGALETLNRDEAVRGIIVQLPLPAHLAEVTVRRRILDSIDPRKDVDGLGAEQAGRLYAGDSRAFMPATARGIMSLCDHYNISLEGKKVVVVGRSNLVGKPVALAALSRNATVIVCHSKTADLAAETKTADVLIVAMGVPKKIGLEHVSPGQTVIDVGIHRQAEGLCGDVDFEAVKDIVGAISPVPGGVGPLTIVSLFQNLCDAAAL